MSASDRLNILLVEDNEDDYILVRDLLRDIDAERFLLEWADSYANGLRAIRAHRHDLILLDFRLHDGTGLELLRETQVLSNRAPVIFMTGQGDHAIDVQVMEAGAADYLIKDRLDADLLERAIRYTVERQKSAEALRASEDRYRTFVENSTEGIWRFELEQPMPTQWPEDEQIAHLERYAYLAECNDAMARLYGFERTSEIIGSRFGEFLSPSEVSDDNYLRRLIHTRYRLVNAEAFGQDRYGQPKYVLHNLIGVVENGLLYRIWGSQSDITERHRSENAQAQLAAIVESSDDAIISKTLDGLIVTWNKGAEALYGYTAREVTGQSISLISPFQPLEQIKRTQERIQHGERIPQLETVNRHKAGNLFDVSVAISPIIDAAGHVTGSSTIVRDISERKRAETRLRQSEANMAAAQRIAHIGSWEIELVNQDDINANPLRWSDETFRIFGYEPGSIAVTNDLFFQAVPAEDQPVISSAVAAAIAERQPYSFVHRIRRPDGAERIVHEIAELVGEEGTGQPLKLVGTVHDVTEQRRTEEQNRFQALLLSQVRNAVVATDLAGRIIYWNNFAETLYQWKAEEVLGRNVADITSPPENQSAAEQAMREIRETGSWQGEWVAQRKDGSVFDAYVVDTLFRDSDGRVTGIVGVSVDITERKSAEKALHASEARFRTLVQSSWDGFHLLDANGQISYESPAATRILGYQPEEMVGHNVVEFVHPDDVNQIIDTTPSQHETPGSTQTLVMRVRHKDGSWRWIDSFRSNFLDNPDVGAIAVNYRDITERKQAEEALRASEAQFRTLVQNSWDVFHLIEPDGRIVYESPAVTRVLGYQPEEMVGHNVLEFMHPDDVDRILKRAVSQLETTGGMRTEILRVHHKNGSWRWVESFEINLLDNPDVGAIAVNYRDITERKQAEDALRVSEQRLRLSLESGRFGTFEIDLLTGRYLDISDIGRTQFALPSNGDVFEGDFFQIVHPDDRAELQMVVATASAARDADFGSDYRIILPNGSVRWVSVYGALTYDVAGLPVHMLGVTQDITERKQVEEELLRLVAIVNSSDDAIIGKTLEGIITSWNPGAEKMFGYSAAEIVGQSMLMLFPPERVDEEQYLLARIGRGESVKHFDTVRVCKDGRRIDVSVTLSPITDGNGKIIGVSKIARDITKRKQAEEERDRIEASLRQSEKRYRSVVETVESLLIVNQEGRLIDANQNACDSLGYTREELLQLRVPDIDLSADPATFALGLEQMASGATRTLILDGLQQRKDGSTFPVEVRVGRMETEGSPFMVAVARDVTDRKQAEAALIQANDELELRVFERTTQLENSHREMSIAKEEAERANAAKSDFLSRMSHELRTPMNSILGFAQIMEMDAPSDKQAIRIGHIIKAGQHLLQLINEVLDLARVESGRLQLSLEPVSVSTCLQSAVDMIRPLCEQRDQQIICDFGAWEPLYVRADQQRLSQVLINLLSNATKYNRDGGVILVNCEQSREGWQQISISDSGAGISAEQMARLFQPFERLEADSRAIEGTGLGLALSKRLVELMGGMIRVESVVGSGSTFVIELPRAKYSRQEIETLPPLPALPNADGRQYTILYIEDNLANLQLIEHVLAGHPQYHLRSAMGGLSGLDMAQDLSPSLIVLDLHLPDLPGDEVLFRLQADPFTRDIPVVIVSADATPGQIRRLLAAGAADYLTKPLDLRLFKDVLHRILLPQEEVSG